MEIFACIWTRKGAGTVDDENSLHHVSRSQIGGRQDCLLAAAGAIRIVNAVPNLAERLEYLWGHLVQSEESGLVGNRDLEE